MEKIRLSVALVTRNRPASLERTLRSLREQSAQPAEVIVSDDSDSDYVEEIEKISGAYDCIYLRGPRRGLYANRNHVALACRGTHIRTMDDDHEFPEAHLENCFRALEGDPESIWIIGEHYPGNVHDIPPPCPGQLTARGFSVSPRDPENCWAISDGASIYPKAIFDRGIRFAENCKFGAGYLEFGSRLHWLGYRIRQLLTTYVLHHFDPLKRSFADEEGELASQFFAMLCHSYIYQPTLANRALCLFELAKERVRRGQIAQRAATDALENYRRHRGLVRAFASKAANAD